MCSFTIDAELLERIRRAAYWTPGATVSGVLESAAKDYVAKLEKERGEPFPPRG
ncbi:MAG: hypothetical protein M9921_13090 [Fimbriimonadaceae bacterium]|nr:hypothetical protein [Fimbriimonadaceae bacterium]